MVEYLAMRIKTGHMSYESVVQKFPQYKEAIDGLLRHSEEQPSESN